MQAATVLSITVAGGLAVAVIALKYDVAKLEDDLARANRDILNEQRAIHVLEAEWTHLNDPSRLAMLATQVLGMHPVDPANMRAFADLPLRAPAGPDQVPAVQPPFTGAHIARAPNRPQSAVASAPLPLDEGPVPADELSVIVPPPVEDAPAEPAHRSAGG
jgi:cell division protein FtsL